MEDEGDLGTRVGPEGVDVEAKWGAVHGRVCITGPAAVRTLL